MKHIVDFVVITLIVGLVAIWWDMGSLNYVEEHGLKGIAMYIWCGKSDCKE